MYCQGQTCTELISREDVQKVCSEIEVVMYDMCEFLQEVGVGEGGKVIYWCKRCSQITYDPLFQNRVCEK